MFADEAGNFDFSESAMAAGKASQWFVLTTVTLEDCGIGERLLALRRELAFSGIELPAGYFHAKDDAQAVRDEVFRTLQGFSFRVDATVLNKKETFARLRDEQRFYKVAWYLHFKYVAPRIIAPGDNVLIVAASLGTKRKRQVFRAAVEDVAAQVVPGRATFHTATWSAESDPCLQVADYCCWAIQRRWERGDDRSRVLIRDKIRSEFNPFGGRPGLAEERAG